MESATRIVVFGDNAVNTTIVSRLNDIGVPAVHHKDTVLGNIQRGPEDPEVIAYSNLMGFIVLTRDSSNVEFEYVTSSDINGKQVQEDFSNNRLLIRNRYFRDCELTLDEIKMSSIE